MRENRSAPAWEGLTVGVDKTAEPVIVPASAGVATTRNGNAAKAVAARAGPASEIRIRAKTEIFVRTPSATIATSPPLGTPAMVCDFPFM